MHEAILPPEPEDQPFYGGLEPATLTEGWCYGYITQCPCAHCRNGCTAGDGYVVAPDGTFAGLAWCTEYRWEFRTLRPGSEDRPFFGIFEPRFSRPVRTLQDLVLNFREVLPFLQGQHRAWLCRASCREGAPVRKRARSIEVDDL